MRIAGPRRQGYTLLVLMAVILKPWSWSYSKMFDNLIKIPGSRKPNSHKTVVVITHPK